MQPNSAAAIPRVTIMLSFDTQAFAATAAPSVAFAVVVATLKTGELVLKSALPTSRTGFYLAKLIALRTALAI